jgi:hypothetical protein
MDTNTRLFLSAAVHILEPSKLAASGGQDDRSRRLSSCETSLFPLRTDGEGLWMESIKKSAEDVAAVYPEHRWTSI